MSRSDYKLLSKAKRQRMKQTILNTVRRAVIGPRGGTDSIATFGADGRTALLDQIRARQRWGFRGKGKYSVGKFVRDVGMLGEGIKKTYNAWIPKSLRDTAVSMAQARMMTGAGMYTGRGAYAANELVAGGVPSMSVNGVGDETEAIVISNREYITDVYGPSDSTFTNQSLTINPGLQQNFPWLSQIAANYDEYEFTKLIFMYKSTIDIGNTNTAGQTGSLIMCCNYNASQPAFTSKDQMMQYHGAVAGKATDDMVMGVECDPAKTARIANYVRVNPVPYGEDPKTYDLGTFQYALNNCPFAMYNIQLGELWVEYECVLRKPKLGTGRGITIQKDVWVSGGQYAATGPRPSAIMGDDVWLCRARNNNLGTKIFNEAIGGSNFISILFPAQYAGRVRIKLAVGCLSSQTAGGGNFTMHNWGNTFPVNDMYGNTTSGWVPTYFVETGFTTSHKVLTLEAHFDIKTATGGEDNKISISGSLLTITGTTYYRLAELSIEEVNPNFSRSATDATIPFILNLTGSDIISLPVQP